MKDMSLELVEKHRDGGALAFHVCEEIIDGNKTFRRVSTSMRMKPIVLFPDGREADFPDTFYNGTVVKGNCYYTHNTIYVTEILQEGSN